MKLRTRAELVYRFDPPTDAIYKIQAAHWPGQHVLEETLTFDPPVAFQEDEDTEFGARTLRCHLEGEVTLTYEAVVDNGRLQGLPPQVSQHDWGDLPAEVLPYLSPSRYCPSDQFGRFVTRAFGDTAGGARVIAILDWISANIDYEHGVSDTETTAARTGWKPSCTSSAAQIAIGTPKPATPSRKAPNAKEISRTWTRWSSETPAIEERMTSNRPERTVIR